MLYDDEPYLCLPLCTVPPSMTISDTHHHRLLQSSSSRHTNRQQCSLPPGARHHGRRRRPRRVRRRRRGGRRSDRRRTADHRRRRRGSLRRRRRRRNHPGGRITHDGTISELKQFFPEPRATDTFLGFSELDCLPPKDVRRVVIILMIHTYVILLQTVDDLMSHTYSYILMYILMFDDDLLIL